MVLLIAVERLGRSVTDWRELVSCKNERIVVKCSRKKGCVAIKLQTGRGLQSFQTTWARVDGSEGFGGDVSLEISGS
jgi:hypothetical protein